MNMKNFFEALTLVEKEKGISRATIIEAFEHAFASGYKRNYDEQAAIAVRIDEKKKTVGFFAQKTVVGEVVNDATELTLEQAAEFKADADYGDVIEFEVTPSDFGRIATQTVKQVIRQHFKKAEQDVLVTEMQDRIGELITGVINKVDERNAYIDLGRIEGTLPLSEVTNMAEVKQGARIKVYITRVDLRNNGKNLVVLVSRRDPNIINKLFELEVPEINDGTIKIVNVVRDVGVRAKVCVMTEDPNVDPIGACVGAGGARIRTIIDGLSGEKIDLIAFSENPATLIANALSPAKVHKVEIDEEAKKASVVVASDQLSLAIGKKGQNVRLAAGLTGWKIDIQIDEELEELRRLQIEDKKAAEKAAASEMERLRMELEAQEAEAAILQAEEDARKAIEEEKAAEFAGKLDNLAALLGIDDDDEDDEDY